MYVCMFITICTVVLSEYNYCTHSIYNCDHLFDTQILRCELYEMIDDMHKTLHETMSRFQSMRNAIPFRQCDCF